MGEFHKCNVEWNKPDTKEHIVYASIHTKSKNSQK